jgi:2-oxoglutarate ferredoxin oxidoreductase subunit delta
MEDRASGDGLKRQWRYPPRSEHPDQEIFIYYDWCKSCGICYEFCPAGVFTSDKSGRPLVSDPDKCTACLLCEMLCPDMAITVYKEPAKKGRS